MKSPRPQVTARAPEPIDRAAPWTPPRGLTIGAIGLFTALAVLLFDPRLFAGGDNAVYYLLAKALATGRGYVTLYEPGDPPHSLYPPGYPVLLIPIFWLFGGSFWAGKAVSLVASVAAVALVGRYLRNRLDPETARRGAFAFALVLFAVNSTALAYSHWMLSEMPFLAVSLGALLLSERPSRDRWSWIGAAALAAASYLIRTASLPLCAAVVWAIWRGRGWRRGIAALVICLAAIGWWAVRNRLVAPDQPGYLSQLVMVNSYYPELGTLTPATFVARVLANLKEYLFLEVPRLVWPFLPSLGIPPPPLAYPLGALLVSLTAYGLLRQVRRRGVRAGEVYAVLYGGILAVWQWQGERFLLPIAPLVLSYLGVGLVELRSRGREARPSKTARTRGRSAKAASPPPTPPAQRDVRARSGLVALAAIPLLVFALRAVPGQISVTLAHIRGDRLAGYEPTVRDYFASAIWIGRHSPADAVVVSRKPMFTYLLGNRKSVIYPFGPPEVIEQAVRAARATYLIYDQLGNSSAVYLTPYLLEFEDDYEVLHQEGDPPTLVLARTGVP
jgi:hypothetical protein